MNELDSRFYLAINPHLGKTRRNGDAWFVATPMDKNKLGQIATVMAEKAGRHTKHSGRKTCITKLLNANVPPTEVAQLSGLRNLMSLNQYNTVSVERQNTCQQWFTPLLLLVILETMLFLITVYLTRN